MQKQQIKNRYFLAIFMAIATLLAVASFVFLTPTKTYAANPQTVSFQGKVVNADGTNVADGTYSFIFRLYNTASPTTTTACSSDASCLFEETNSSVTVTSGVFQVELGSTCLANGGIVGGASDTCTKSTTIDFSSSNALYLTMKFNGDSNGFMSPTIHFNSVPYAFYADNSAKLGGLAAGNYVQLAQGVQTDTDASNPSIFINKNNSSGTPNILQLQKGGVDVLTVTNTSAVKVQGINSTATLGSELISGTTCSGANWAGSGTGPYTHTTGVTTALVCTPPATVTASAVYQLTYTVASRTAGSVVVRVGNAILGGGLIAFNTTDTELVTASNTNPPQFTPTSTFDGQVTITSLKQVTQTTNQVVGITNSDGTIGIEIRSGGSGLNNTYIGTNSAVYNTTGNSNVSLGVQALQNNTSGSGNTAVGGAALAHNTTGGANNSFGVNADGFNMTGSNNNAFGNLTMFNNISGSMNTAIGNEALRAPTSGSFNTALGGESGYRDPNVTQFVTAANLQNATMVGYGAQAQASNVLILGGIGTTASNLTPNVGIGTTSPTNLFSISPNYYDTGVAYQDNGSAGVAGTTIHGSGTTWTAQMVGMEFIFESTDGSTVQKETITGFTNPTTLTGSVSQLVGLVGTTKKYRIHNPAFYVTNTGQTSIRTSTDSTAAFQVQNSSGTSLFTVDTQNSKLIWGTSSIQRVASGTTTIDLNDTGATTLSVANSDGTGVASLSVEGDISAGSGRVFKVGATSGSTISACGANNYISSFASTGGLVTGGSCGTIASTNLSDGANLVKLAQGVQNDTSTTNPSIFINKNNASGTPNILELQKASSDVLVVDNGGLISLQPAAALTGTGTQSHITQSLTNNQTAGTVNGYNQTITVSNASGTTTTNGVNISLTDSTTFGNKNYGINVALSGTNANQGQIGLNSSVVKGFGVVGVSSGNNSASLSCGNGSMSGNSIGVCGASTIASGIGTAGQAFGDGADLVNALLNPGSGVSGFSTTNSTTNNPRVGVSGAANATGTSGSYKAIGTYGIAKAASATASVYGGYFNLDPASITTAGASLYASNSTLTSNILQLQDNTTDVLTVADGGALTITPVGNNIGTIVRQTSGTAISGNIFDIQGANGTSHFLQVTETAANAGSISITSLGANAVTLDAGSGTVILGSNTTTLQKAGGLTLDLASNATNTLTVSNSNGANVASISATGDIGVGSGRVFKVGATSGSSISACGSTQYISSQAVSGGIVTGGSCTNAVTNMQTAYNGGSTITLASSPGGILIQDNATPIGGNLFAVQKNAGSVTYLGVTATGLNIQSNATGSAVTALAFDTSTTQPHLKIYGANGTNYADIYYDSSTSTAYYGANTGTAVLGNGTGAVNVTAGAGAAAIITGNAASSFSTTAGNITLDSGGGTLILGSNTTTLQKSGTSLTLDVNSSSNSTLTVTNAGTGTGSLSVEGAITGGGNITAGASSTYSSSSGTATYTATTNSTFTAGGTTTLTSTTGTTVSAASGQNVSISTAGAGTISVQSSAAFTLQGAATSSITTTSGNLTIDATSGATPSISIGTGGQNKTISIGNNQSSTTATVTTATVSHTQDTNGFRIANNNGTATNNLLNIDVTKANASNLVANSSFEGAVSNWSALNAGAASQTAAQVYEGTKSLLIVTGTNASGGGTSYSTGSSFLANGTTYTLSAYVKTDSNLPVSTFEMGHADNGSTPTLVPCLTGQSLPQNSGWQKLTCTWTSGAITGNPFIYFKQTDSTNRNLYIDDVLLQTDTNSDTSYRNAALNLAGTTVNSALILQNAVNSSNAFSIQNSGGSAIVNVDTTDTNLISNPGFEANQNGWAANGSSTLVRSSAQAYLGYYSLKVTASANANNGAQISLNPVVTSTGTTYTISWFAKLDGTSSAMTDMAALFSADGATTVACTPADQVVVSTGWKRFSCSVASGATTPSTSGFVRILQTGTTAGHIYYIDGVQLEASAAASAYGAGSLSLNGIISSPVIFKSAAATTAFQIQNTSGLNMLVADTLNGNVQIGSGTSDANAILLGLDSYNGSFTPNTAPGSGPEVANGCTTTSNQGSMYYSTTTNAIRGCINGSWEDVVSTASLGLQLFGVVPDTGTNIGDLAGVTGLTNGPCRVSVGGTTSTVAWTGCVAFSGGRKIIVSAGSTTTAAGTSATVIWQHLCLTGSNGAPALSGINTEAANLNTVSLQASIGSPILCLADIKVTNGSAVITGIYDTRTYTTTTKIYATAITTPPTLGMLVKTGTTTPGSVVATSTATDTSLEGVVVASTGSTSTNTINAVIATNGPGAVKAISGTSNAVGGFIIPTTTAGYAGVATAYTSTNYGALGTARTAWTGATACAINSNACAGSVLTNIKPR